jgi:hypothetical protein
MGGNDMTGKVIPIGQARRAQQLALKATKVWDGGSVYSGWLHADGSAEICMQISADGKVRELSIQPTEEHLRAIIIGHEKLLCALMERKWMARGAHRWVATPLPGDTPRRLVRHDDKEAVFWRHYARKIWPCVACGNAITAGRVYWSEERGKEYRRWPWAKLCDACASPVLGVVR